MGGAAGTLLAFGVVASSVAFATWPLAGRSAEQWTPVVGLFLLRRTGGPHRLRGTLSGFELDEISLGSAGRRIGVVVDRVAGTCTAAVKVGGSGFALGDEAERARRIAAWSGVLAGSARDGGALHRLQWVARCLPDGFADSTQAREVAARGIASASYRTLLEEVSPVLWRHDVILALSVRASKGRSHLLGVSTAETMIGELEALERRCLSAGLEVGGVLSPAALTATIESAFSVSGAPQVAQDCPWPSVVEENWSKLRTDASWHAVYWIAEWPRAGIGSDFLVPLLLEGGLRRTIAVSLAPVPPLRAVRRAEHDRTSGVADAELRRRHGFSVTARSRNEQEATSRREAELADGHAAFRFTGYLGVTAGAEAGLEAACGRLEQIAAQAQLDLHRMYGAQEEGCACLLPTGRGCA
jgi:hypothetical protein